MCPSVNPVSFRLGSSSTLIWGRQPTSFFFSSSVVKFNYVLLKFLNYFFNKKNIQLVDFIINQAESRHKLLLIIYKIKLFARRYQIDTYKTFLTFRFKRDGRPIIKRQLKAKKMCAKGVRVSYDLSYYAKALVANKFLRKKYFSFKNNNAINRFRLKQAFYFENNKSLVGLLQGRAHFMYKILATLNNSKFLRINRVTQSDFICLTKHLPKKKRTRTGTYLLNFLRSAAYFRAYTTHARIYRVRKKNTNKYFKFKIRTNNKSRSKRQNMLKYSPKHILGRKTNNKLHLQTLRLYKKYLTNRRNDFLFFTNFNDKVYSLDQKFFYNKGIDHSLNCINDPLFRSTSTSDLFGNYLFGVFGDEAFKLKKFSFLTKCTEAWTAQYMLTFYNHITPTKFLTKQSSGLSHYYLLKNSFSYLRFKLYSKKLLAWRQNKQQRGIKANLLLRAFSRINKYGGYEKKLKGVDTDLCVIKPTIKKSVDKLTKKLYTYQKTERNFYNRCQKIKDIFIASSSHGRPLRLDELLLNRTSSIFLNTNKFSRAGGISYNKLEYQKKIGNFFFDIKNSSQIIYTKITEAKNYNNNNTTSKTFNYFNNSWKTMYRSNFFLNKLTKLYPTLGVYDHAARITNNGLQRNEQNPRIMNITPWWLKKYQNKIQTLFSMFLTTRLAQNKFFLPNARKKTNSWILVSRMLKKKKRKSLSRPLKRLFLTNNLKSVVYNGKRLLQNIDVPFYNKEPMLLLKNISKENCSKFSYIQTKSFRPTLSSLIAPHKSFINKLVNSTETNYGNLFLNKFYYTLSNRLLFFKKTNNESLLRYKKNLLFHFEKKCVNRHMKKQHKLHTIVKTVKKINRIFVKRHQVFKRGLRRVNKKRDLSRSLSPFYSKNFSKKITKNNSFTINLKNKPKINSLLLRNSYYTWLLRHSTLQNSFFLRKRSVNFFNKKVLLKRYKKVQFPVYFLKKYPQTFVDYLLFNNSKPNNFLNPKHVYNKQKTLILNFFFINLLKKMRSNYYRKLIFFPQATLGGFVSKVLAKIIEIKKRTGLLNGDLNNVSGKKSSCDLKTRVINFNTQAAAVVANNSSKINKPNFLAGYAKRQPNDIWKKSKEFDTLYKLRKSRKERRKKRKAAVFVKRFLKRKELLLIPADFKRPRGWVYKEIPINNQRFYRNIFHKIKLYNNFPDLEKQIRDIIRRKKVHEHLVKLKKKLSRKTAPIRKKTTKHKKKTFVKTKRLEPSKKTTKQQKTTSLKTKTSAIRKKTFNYIEQRNKQREHIRLFFNRDVKDKFKLTHRGSRFARKFFLYSTVYRYAYSVGASRSLRRKITEPIANILYPQVRKEFTRYSWSDLLTGDLRNITKERPVLREIQYTGLRQNTNKPVFKKHIIQNQVMYNNRRYNTRSKFVVKSARNFFLSKENLACQKGSFSPKLFFNLFSLPAALRFTFVSKETTLAYFLESQQTTATNKSLLISVLTSLTVIFEQFLTGMVGTWNRVTKLTNRLKKKIRFFFTLRVCSGAKKKKKNQLLWKKTSMAWFVKKQEILFLEFFFNHLFSSAFKISLFWAFNLLSYAEKLGSFLGKKSVFKQAHIPRRAQVFCRNFINLLRYGIKFYTLNGISSYFAREFYSRARQRIFLITVEKILRYMNFITLHFTGFCMLVSGKLSRQPRAKKSFLIKGLRPALNRFDLKTNYVYRTVRCSFGSYGIKMWLYYT